MMPFNTRVAPAFCGVYYKDPSQGWMDISQKPSRTIKENDLKDTFYAKYIAKDYFLLSGTLDGSPKITLNCSPIMVTGKEKGAIPTATSFLDGSTAKGNSENVLAALFSKWLDGAFTFKQYTSINKDAFNILAELNPAKT